LTAGPHRPPLQDTFPRCLSLTLFSCQRTTRSFQTHRGRALYNRATGLSRGWSDRREMLSRIVAEWSLYSSRPRLVKHAGCAVGVIAWSRDCVGVSQSATHTDLAQRKSPGIDPQVDEALDPLQLRLNLV
jgi:hypothetical protein